LAEISLPAEWGPQQPVPTVNFPSHRLNYINLEYWIVSLGTSSPPSELQRRLICSRESAHEDRGDCVTASLRPESAGAALLTKASRC